MFPFLQLFFNLHFIDSDPHYMHQNFCISQNNVQNDPRGCFVLNHDPPSTEYQYNSTDDVLRYIQNPRYINYFTVISHCYVPY
jgi:hypothetical protein